MGIKKKTAKKVIDKITKNVDVDKIIENTIDKVTNSVETRVEKDIEKEEKELQAKKEKTIENIKNLRVENNSEDIINFFIEAKKNIKNKNIDSDEYNMWFLKIDEVYEKAQEFITDKKTLDKIEKKYEELKEIKKIKKFWWIAFAYIYIIMFICIFFGLNGLFLVGLGISILVCTIITFVYFNIDFFNIARSVKKFEIKDTTENLICLCTSVLSVIFIFIGIVIYFSAKAETDEAYKNYYDENVEKYNVSIDVDFKDNLLFDKCDITLKIYDEEEYFEHGEDKAIDIELPKGTHKLEFNGNDDKEIIKLKINDDTKVKYKLECLSGGIEVIQVSKDN